MHAIGVSAIESAVAKNEWSNEAQRYYSGWLADLDDLVEKCAGKLEQKGDIFVPFVNESIVPFNQQKLRRADNPVELEHILIVSQAPAEMR